jgi:hypothetical protein
MATIEAIQPETAAFLLTPTGRAAVDALCDAVLDDDQTHLLLARLRRSFAPAEAGAILAMARLRRRAAAKFPDAGRLFFTAEALEQATAWPVAAHHAAWIDRHAPPGPVLDLGAGIGGDLLALAARRPVIAYESDPVRASFAAANAETLGLADRVEVRTADWVAAQQAGQLPPAAAVYADPARRVDERRVFSLHRIQPPIAALLPLAAQAAVLGVKVMPGLDMAEVPSRCGVEFISHIGVCKEAVLWFGPAAWQPRWASVLLPGHTERVAGDRETPPLGPLAPGQVLYEPDPAMIRAGCLATLCGRLDAHLFDPQIAYLVAPAWRAEPLAQAFTVEEVHPFSLKLLNRRLAALQIGTVELKKRGFPAEPETLRSRLALAKGGRPGVVIFTRRGDERVMLIGRRVIEK